jgi:AraC-like DNA-binding protein
VGCAFAWIESSSMGDCPAASQSFSERVPVPALRKYVTCAWVQQVGAKAPPYRHRTVPNGSAELVCVVGSVPKVVGPQTRPTEELVAPGTIAVGVRFRPGAASAALAAPASEFLDLQVTADELWSRFAVAVGERVAAAASPQTALALLESAVVDRVRAQAAAVDGVAIEAARRLRGASNDGVRTLARSLGISERQLRRRCERSTGLRPKTLHRMFRFQRFLALAGADTAARPSLARLARDAGYSDQSHLSRESVRLAGRPPARVLRDADDDCRDSHDHAASYGPFLANAIWYARLLRETSA